MALHFSTTASSATTGQSSADRRWKVLEVAMKRQRFRQDALIEVLHTAQRTFGYLEPAVLTFVAKQLKLPPSRVFGVATFYKLFTLKPKGEHTCVVCTGTACYVHGSDNLLEVIQEVAHIKEGETTREGEVSLLTARCLGACGTAPVVVYDEVLFGKQTADSVRAQCEKWLKHEPATST